MDLLACRHPFPEFKTISMICGGTGITPMYQALQLMYPGSDTKVKMLYGNKTAGDILLKKELDEMAASNPNFELVHVVGDSPTDKPAGWDGEFGWIDEEKIKKFCFAPSDDTGVFVCGLPAMYAALCGPRDQKEVASGTVLNKLGYSDSMVVKF